jgi:starvation-inducible DNA-binding protein
MDAVADDDRVSEDLLIGQIGSLERYQWFVRSHLADWAGGMANAGTHSEMGAAKAVTAKKKTSTRSKDRATNGRADSRRTTP